MEFIVDNRQKFEDFRIKYPVFAYNSYSWSKEGATLKLFFEYSFSAEKEDQITTSLEVNLTEEVRDEVIRQNEDYIFRIGLVNALSYWKAFCSPHFKIACGDLDEAELSWWQDLWYEGMGEFRYRNKLLDVSKNDWVKFILSNKQARPVSNRPCLLSGNLIAFTGGKDSSLALGLIGESDEKDNEIFSINPSMNMEKIRKMLSFGDYPETIINRAVHDRLLFLNKNGALNGHTPFSVVVALVGVLIASLRNKKYVIVSNESSADEATVPGTEINHQYSKSLVFEKKFRDYCSLVWDDGPIYFSLLRPLTEIGIISLLKKYEGIIPYVYSCNIKNKTSLWCGRCGKCFFSFLMFGAVWDIQFAEKIIGVNMLQMPENMDILYELTGVYSNKPFECVGTSAESLSAISVILNKFPDARKELLLEIFLDKYENRLPIADDFNHIACEFHEHLMPEKFEKIIKEAQGKICYAK